VIRYKPGIPFGGPLIFVVLFDPIPVRLGAEPSIPKSRK